MRSVLVLAGAIAAGLLGAAACGTSSGPEADGNLGALRQPVPFPTVLPTIKPPQLHLQSFGTGLPTAAATYEAALKVRAVRLGLDGYVVLARRISTQPQLSVRYVVYRLDTRGAPIWSQPFVADLGQTLVDVREYRGPSFKGFVLAGYTGSSCSGVCTPNSGVLVALDANGVQRAAGFYAPSGDGVTRLKSVVQAPDGTLLAAGETTGPGACQRLSAGSYDKPLGQPSGLFVTQQNAITGLRFSASTSSRTSLCPEGSKGAVPTNSSLSSLTVLGDGRRVVAVGSRLNAGTHRFEGLNVALEPTAGASSWVQAAAATLRGASSYGGARGETHAESLARASADSFVVAGYTSAFNAAGRRGDAGFIRRFRLGSDGSFVDAWGTSDPAAGTFFYPAAGWRFFGGWVQSQLYDVTVSGGYVFSVGSSDLPWNARYLYQRVTAAPSDNSLRVRVNVADGNDKLLAALPVVQTLQDARPYDSGLRGADGTLGSAFAAAGFAKVPGHTSKVFMAQIDPDLTFDGTFTPPDDAPPDDTPPDDTPPFDAEAYYNDTCADCHGDKHQGGTDFIKGPCLLGVSRDCAINRVSCGVSSSPMNSYCSELTFDQVETLADWLSTYVSPGTSCAVPPKCGSATGLPECHEDLCVVP